MKRIRFIYTAIVMVAVFAGQINAISLSAQVIPGLDVKTKISGNPEGKTLTMEETILSGSIHPSRYYTRWTGENTLMYIKTGKLIEYNVNTRTESKYYSEPSPAAKIRQALPKEAENVFFSKSEAYAAFTKGKSLYYIDSNLQTYPIAVSENPDITYGQSVSRNEFGINSGIFWSPDSKQIAFYRKDEQLVTDFPLLDITTRTGSLIKLKYPMNGMASENIRLGIYNLSSNSIIYVAADDFGYDQYLTNISWSPDSRFVFIQVLDRSQKHMRLNMYRANDGSFVKTILTEENEKYVEPLDPLRWLTGTDKFIYRTDNRDGFKNLYLCDTLGNVMRLTETDADVQLIAENGKSIFYSSAEISPSEKHVFRMDISVGRNGKVKKSNPIQLTSGSGWHNANFNEECTWFVDNWSSFDMPGQTQIISADGKQRIEMSTSENPLKDYATGEMLFGTVKSADGKYDNWFRMFLPVDFNPEKKYPVILYVYGGPHSQMVTNSWLGQVRMWEVYMAQRGYIVYVQDNRGTQNHGADYEKAIHKQCGQVEMADQMEGINALKSLPYVDSSRIGVHGWSYGGFMTISLMTNYPETFKVGVAGGPVIDWKWYEVMYGERYMETAKSNPMGFYKTSLINKAKDLKGKLLICQGAIDDTVLWEHSLSFIRECIKNNVQVDYFPYPCAKHNVMGKDRVHLMDKVTMYFEDYL